MQLHLFRRGLNHCFAFQLDELQLCKNCFYLSNARPDNWFCYPCVCGILRFSFIENCVDQLFPVYLRMIIPVKYISLHHIVHVILMSTCRWNMTKQQLFLSSEFQAALSKTMHALGPLINRRASLCFSSHFQQETCGFAPICSSIISYEMAVCRRLRAESPVTDIRWT